MINNVLLPEEWSYKTRTEFKPRTTETLAVCKQRNDGLRDWMLLYSSMSFQLFLAAEKALHIRKARMNKDIGEKLVKYGSHGAKKLLSDANLAAIPPTICQMIKAANGYDYICAEGLIVAPSQWTASEAVAFNIPEDFALIKEVLLKYKDHSSKS